MSFVFGGADKKEPVSYDFKLSAKEKKEAKKIAEDIKLTVEKNIDNFNQKDFLNEDKKQIIFGAVSQYLEGLLNKDKPHHLLGCGVPQEFEYYRRAGYDWIYSVDTSNPVVHGIKDIRYTDQGLWNKESQKLFTMINSEVSEEQMEVIRYNVEKFRWFCNGGE